MGPKVAFVNERKPIRDAPKSSTARPRNPHKGSWMLILIALFVLVLFRIYLFVSFFFVFFACLEPPKTDIHHHSFISQVPDVRHMERALLGLLADFHSGKLRAFGGGNTMEQMTNIREQQEKLAKLHFDLAGAATVPSLSEDSLQSSQNTMSQLIQRLEQLSVSIEALHSNSTK